MAEGDVVVFAEKLLELLDQGSFQTTYKYAVLLGLMDLCVEHTTAKGHGPSSVTTRQLGARREVGGAEPGGRGSSETLRPARGGMSTRRGR